MNNDSGTTETRPQALKFTNKTRPHENRDNEGVGVQVFRNQICLLSEIVRNSKFDINTAYFYKSIFYMVLKTMERVPHFTITNTHILRGYLYREETEWDVISNRNNSNGFLVNKLL